MIKLLMKSIVLHDIYKIGLSKIKYRWIFI